MGLKKATVKLGADISEFTSKMQKASKTFKRLGANLTRNVTAPIAAMTTGAVMAASKFEKSMNKVRAITGATGSDFTKLNSQAKLLGKTTQFSASQAAEAMSFLGMAGFKTEEIISAMPATLNLAAAGAMDLGTAADIASNILSGFGADASELSNISDVLAKAMTSSNTNVEQLGNAMKMVAPVSKGFGISLEETTAAIGKLSDAGIQGESAGTGLRGILATLSEKAGELGMNVFDASGNMRPLNEMLTEIANSGHSTAKIMDVFGKKAGPSMLALLDVGGEGLKNFTTQLENSGGTAKKIADTQMQGLSGQLVKLKSATEGLAISFGELIIPILMKLVSIVQGAIDTFNNLDGGIKIALVTLGGLLATIGPLVTLFGSLVSVVGFFMTPLGAAIAGIAALAAAAIYVSDNLEVLGQIGKMMAVSLGNAFLNIGQMLITPFELAIDGINKVLSLLGKEEFKNPFTSMKDGLEGLKGEVPAVTAEFGSFGDAVSNAATKAKNALFGLGTSAGVGTGSGVPAFAGGGSSGTAGSSDSPISQMTEDVKELTTASQELGLTMTKSFADSFSQAVVSGENFLVSMKNIFVDLARQIAAMLVKAALLAAVFSLIPGLGAAQTAAGGSKSFGGIFKSMIGGSFANGGTPPLGKVSLVGEKGPELFVPSSAGSIVPNDALGGSVIPDVRISGDDLLIVFDRANRRKARR